jgi:type I site-specific restriction-modification system R (restriction) subunit
VVWRTTTPVRNIKADRPRTVKNNITKQTAEDAVEQYKRDRDPRELLFQFGRCIAHFAVDDQVVRFCTELKGKASWFLPFDQGYDDGAGNPPNPDGLKTDYLWKRILAPAKRSLIHDVRWVSLGPGPARFRPGSPR